MATTYQCSSCPETVTVGGSSTRPTVRTTETNAGSIRYADMLAQGERGLIVSRVEHDGTTTTLRTHNMATGDARTISYPVSQMVELVHPDDHGKELDRTF